MKKNTVLVVAKSRKGAEYMYSVMSAHKVSARSGQRICDQLNSMKYDLKGDQVWSVHEVDKYDSAYDMAQEQKFYIAKGYLREKRMYDPWSM